MTTTNKTLAESIEEGEVRRARLDQECAAFRADAAQPLSAETLTSIAASNKAYKAAWKAAKKAGMSKAEFFAHYHSSK